MRNIHAQDYGRIDYRIMWKIVTIRIPELKEQLILLV